MQAIQIIKFFSKVICALFLISIGLFLFSCTNGTTQDEDPPNFIIVLADDLGWNQLGCYGGPYQTPFIDKLADEGMRFMNAYSSAPVCSPTRAALMTGKYPARIGLTDFIKGGTFRDSLLRQPEWQKFLPLEEITMAEIFREYGYRTALFGKWHLSREKKPPESEAYNPEMQGFDESLITYKPVRKQTDPERDPHNVDSITDRSVRFLEENRNQPFFLVVSHNAIHDPVMESRDRVDRFVNTNPDPAYRVVPDLGAMVSRLDDGTGRLLLKLRELGLEKNTIVFFCSDNGGKESYASQHPLRKGKGWLYEGGVRVPMIVRWPGKIEAGACNDYISSTIDVLPTLLELGGLPALKHPIDGISFAPVLLGCEPAEEYPQYWHYPHYHAGSGMKPASALRKGKYKLIEWHEELLTGKPYWELYDLDTDPGETKNLAHDLPEVLDELCINLNNWKEEVRAQMPVLREMKNPNE